MKDIKPTINKIRLDDAKSNEIRSKLMQKKGVTHMWMIPVAAVLTAIVVLMVIPYTRNAVVNAAEKLFKNYEVRLLSGEDVGWGTDPDTGKEYSWMHGNAQDQIALAEAKDGRLYMVLDDEWTDITDKCSGTEYYRYEVVHEDGVKEVIMIGGKPEGHRYGWILVVYDPDGTRIAEICNIPYSSPRMYVDCDAEDFEWVTTARHDEGIPCNNRNCEICYGSGR